MELVGWHTPRWTRFNLFQRLFPQLQTSRLAVSREQHRLASGTCKQVQVRIVEMRSEARRIKAKKRKRKRGVHGGWMGRAAAEQREKKRSKREGGGGKKKRATKVRYEIQMVRQNGDMSQD